MLAEDGLDRLQKVHRLVEQRELDWFFRGSEGLDWKPGHGKRCQRDLWVERRRYRRRDWCVDFFHGVVGHSRHELVGWGYDGVVV